MEKDVRCTRCRAEFTDDELEGAKACPACGTTGVPCRISHDVDIRINWHELRILTIWASNYASAAGGVNRQSREALAAILHSLALQHPEYADVQPLTLFGEVEQLRRAVEGGEFGPDMTVETNVRDILDED